MKERVIAEIMDCIESKQKTAEQLSEKIAAAAQMCIEAYKNGNKVLLCGNGGSAADAQHIAAELVARFYLERKALPAIALNTDTSILTALGNDYDFDYIYKRQVEAHGNRGDILFGISTSGNSPNVIAACEYAKSIGMKTIGLSGKDGGKLDKAVDLSLVVPSAITPRIQENHIMIGHIICNLVEQELFGDNNG